MKLVAVLVVVVVLLVGCSSKQPDASAQLACEHFDQLTKDVKAGIKTGDEMRSSLNSIWKSYASVSANPRVKSAFEALLAAATQGTDPPGAVSDVVDACNSL